MYNKDFKGDFYACAFWPVDYGKSTPYTFNCNNGTAEITTAACNIPKTYDSPIGDDCTAILARNLRSQSHLLAWYYGTFSVLIAMLLYCFFRASSYFTYTQAHFMRIYQVGQMFCNIKL